MPDAGALRVLLVEDNPGDADLARDALEALALPIQLTVAEDGDRALQVLRDGLRPRLVLLDLNLPRRSGQQVLAEIKGDAALRRTPVVVLTSSSSPHDVRQCYELGANCYLTKPMGLDAFQDLLRSAGRFWLTLVQPPP